MKASLFAVLAALALALAACGGGGGGGSSNGGGVIPNGPGGSPGPTGSPATTATPGSTPTPIPGSTPTPKPGTTPTPGSTPTPGVTPTPVRTPTPRPSVSPTPAKTPTPGPSSTPVHTPSPIPSQSPAPGQSYPPSIVPSTWGRIGLAQIFDYFPSTGTSMSTSQVSSDAFRYDLVWGSFNNNGDNDPVTWRSANPKTFVSRYYIITEDNTIVSGNTLAYWQQNHPDWMLYACDSSGNPTRDLAYTPGDGFKDIVLNIHNPTVVNWQVQSLVNYVMQNGYNTLALDEVIFSDFMYGGNPAWGQTVNKTEYACGTWNSDFTQFTKIYNGRNDPTWTTDTVNWVMAARQAANANHLAVIVNHPAGTVGNPNEEALLSNVDVTMDESGFSDYGNPTSTSYFLGTLNYMKHVQSLGKAFVLINKYQQDSGRVATCSPASPVPCFDHLEYSLGTYLIGNEGNADLFTVTSNGPGTGYGAEQFYQEYGVNFGTPCGEMTKDATSPDIYYRRFTHGLAVVNAGKTQVETATLPSSHQYTDIDRGAVGTTVGVNPNDAYVLTTGGNGCQ